MVAMMSIIDCIHPLRIVGLPFQHDKGVEIDYLMPDMAASLSKLCSFLQVSKWQAPLTIILIQRQTTSSSLAIVNPKIQPIILYFNVYHPVGNHGYHIVQCIRMTGVWGKISYIERHLSIFLTLYRGPFHLKSPELIPLVMSFPPISFARCDSDKLLRAGVWESMVYARCACVCHTPHTT